jgi:hypothetical protein
MPKYSYYSCEDEFRLLKMWNSDSMMLRDFDAPSAVMRLIVMALVPEQVRFWVVIKR